MATAHWICVCLKAGEMEDAFPDLPFVSEPAATASAPTAPSNEHGDGDDACSTLRNEMRPFVLPNSLQLCYSGCPREYQDFTKTIWAPKSRKMRI
jgi:hypothetical protein